MRKKLLAEAPSYVPDADLAAGGCTATARGRGQDLAGRKTGSQLGTRGNGTEQYPLHCLGKPDSALWQCGTGCGQGRVQDMYLGIVAEGQGGDLLRVAKPVLLGTRMQVLHHHQAATRIGKEACRQGGCQCPRHCQLLHGFMGMWIEVPLWEGHVPVLYPQASNR